MKLHLTCLLTWLHIHSCACQSRKPINKPLICYKHWINKVAFENHRLLMRKRQSWALWSSLSFESVSEYITFFSVQATAWLTDFSSVLSFTYKWNTYSLWVRPSLFVMLIRISDKKASTLILSPRSAYESMYACILIVAFPRCLILRAKRNKSVFEFFVLITTRTSCANRN
jgi:hypothetical protein